MASGGPGAAGPAVTVEPSAEALAAVQAVFARAPQLVASASVDIMVSGAPLLATAAGGPQAAGLKRQRLSMSSFNLTAAAPSTSVFTDHVPPPTPPQHPISRRTSAPY